METTPDTPATTAPKGNGRSVDKRPKTRLLTREQLDGRTKARKQFDAIASGIANDLGGTDNLSTVQKTLVEAYAGASLLVSNLNAQLLLGKDVNILELSAAISTMVRIASRVGINRLPKDVSSLGDMMRADIDSRTVDND
jgi:hypothetical protein